MATIRREHGGSKPIAGKKLPSKPKAGTSFLDDIEESSQEDDAGISMIIYGRPGVGKTSLGAYAPSPLFICDKQEKGVLRLKRFKLIPQSVKVAPIVESWSGLLSGLDELLTGDHAFETICIDSLTGMQRLCFEACCNERWNGDMSKDGFFAYGSGPKTAAQEYWPEFLDKLTDLQEQNINVILMAHTTIKLYNNPSGPDYDQIVPDLDKAIWASTSRWAGALLHYQHNIDISKEKKDRKFKATGGESRFLSAEFDAACEAKNTYGLPPILEPQSSAKECWDEMWKLIQARINPEKKKKPV